MTLKGPKPAWTIYIVPPGQPELYNETLSKGNNNNKNYLNGQYELIPTRNKYFLRAAEISSPYLYPILFLFVLFFETEFLYVALAVLELLCRLGCPGSHRDPVLGLTVYTTLPSLCPILRKEYTEQ